jgi:hypothetical protein
MMSFQKLVAFVALTVFALQGAMAVPQRPPPFKQSPRKRDI